MSIGQRTPRFFTAEEYLRIERPAPFKSEFFHGRLYVRPDSEEAHIFIHANLVRAAGNRLAGMNCHGMGNDLKVRTPAQDFFAYPDLTIVCGERVYHDAERDILLNPMILLEIVSPSTEAVDRGSKFLMYQQLESLREYVLVSQNTPRVEWYLRGENNEWIYAIAIGLEASVTLSSLGITLPLSEIYANIALPPALSVAK